MAEPTDPFPWRYWPQYGSEVREIRFATQRDAIAYGAGNAVFAPREPVDGEL